MDLSLSRFFRDARSERLSDDEKLSLKKELITAIQARPALAYVRMELSPIAISH